MNQTLRAAMAAMTCALAGAAVAEPAPAPPIDPGRYDTPWGAGELRMVSGNTAVLTLVDGTVFWGSLGNGGREWNGRWVRSASSARTDRDHRPCRTPRGAVPSSFPVPSGGYWGRFSAHSVRSERARALSLTWSNCADPPAGEANRFNVVHSGPPVFTASANVGRAVPSQPYDGPCWSVRSRAVATISPCALDFARPFRVTLLRDMKKAVTRITFTPLVDNPAAVAAAVRSNTVLPVHPGRREVYQVLRGGKLHLRGSSTEVTPPATICEHDYWIVNVLDGNGDRHPGNGVIAVSCGPNKVGTISRPLEPLRARK